MQTITIDAFSHKTFLVSSVGKPWNSSHTLGQGPFPYLLVFATILTESYNEIIQPVVTYNSIALTKIAQLSDLVFQPNSAAPVYSETFVTEVWYLPANQMPKPGTYNINFNGGMDTNPSFQEGLILQGLTLFNVAPKVPEVTTNQTGIFSAATPIETDITTQSINSMIVNFAASYKDQTWTADPAQTTDGSDDLSGGASAITSHLLGSSIGTYAIKNTGTNPDRSHLWALGLSYWNPTSSSVF